MMESDARERRLRLEAFAGFCRDLHARRIDADLSPANVSPDDSGFRLRDPGRKRLWLGGHRWRRLAELHRAAPGGVSAPDRLRFLDAYLGCASGAARRAAWQSIRAAYRRLLRAEARRAARAAFRPGPQLVREGAALCVAGREDAPAVRLHLDTAQCRTIWTLTHVFEQLGLPALRPVRLDEQFVDLLAPELDDNAMEYHAAVARARRRFEFWGRFVRDPQWALTPRGAVLLTPNAFRLEL